MRMRMLAIEILHMHDLLTCLDLRLSLLNTLSRF